MAPRSTKPPYRVPVMPGTGRDPRARLAAQVEPGPSYMPRPPTSPLELAREQAGLVGQSAGAPGTGPEPRLVHDPGGDVVQQLLPEGFIIVDELYRKLPQDGMFLPTVNPRRPFSFLIGSYVVPKGMHLWLSSYRFGTMLLAGVEPGDLRYAEPGRYAGSITWDINVDGYRQGHLRYQIDPRPIETAPTRALTVGGAFGTPVASSTALPSKSFRTVGSLGESALPTDGAIQGPHRGNPWTWVVQAGQTVQCQCVVFRRLKTPIGDIYARIGGYLLHAQTSETLIQRMRPR